MPLAITSRAVNPVRQGNSQQANGLMDEARADEKVEESWRVILIGFVMS